MGLGIKGGGAVEEAAAAEHHPARLQLFISAVHKAPAQTQTQTQTQGVHVRVCLNTSCCCLEVDLFVHDAAKFCGFHAK